VGVCLHDHPVLPIGLLVIDGFAKGMARLHPKPEGPDPESYCGDVYKMEVSGDYKTLWQQFWKCNNPAYDPESGDMEVHNNQLSCEVLTQVLNEFLNTLNVSLFVLKHVLPLCDYKVWIDTKRGAAVIHYLHTMVHLNIMEENFYARRMEERKCVTYFALHHEMDREQDKEKGEEERAQKHEKARHARESFAQGGEKALIKGKWPHLT
jgi:hypothetical protein